MATIESPVVISLTSHSDLDSPELARLAQQFALPPGEGLRQVIALTASGTSVAFSVPIKVADELAEKAAGGVHHSVEDLVLDIMGRTRADHRT